MGKDATQVNTYPGGTLAVGTDVGRFNNHLPIIRKWPDRAGPLQLGHLGSLILHATGGVPRKEERGARGQHRSREDEVRPVEGLI